MNTYIKYTYRLFNMKSIKRFFNKLIQGNVLMTPTGIIQMNFSFMKTILLFVLFGIILLSVKKIDNYYYRNYK